MSLASVVLHRSRMAGDACPGSPASPAVTWMSACATLSEPFARCAVGVSCVGDARTEKERTFDSALNVLALKHICEQQTKIITHWIFFDKMNGKNRWGVWKELSNLRWERIQLTSHWACGNHVCYHCNEYCTISLRNVWQKCIDSRKWLTRTFLQVTACRN